MKPNPKLVVDVRSSTESAQLSSATGKDSRILVILSLEGEL